MWTFEDIHMLVGSNMPIFGGGRYPAVSLRLRLVSKKFDLRINLCCHVVYLNLCLVTLLLLNLISNFLAVFFRDNNKPINILTGIDYWLDNLMCNVPELVMCFHVNGIVQVS